MSIISLIFEKDLHYLDHLAPLSSLLNIPLVCCNEDVFETATKYYPDLKCFFCPSLNAPPIAEAKTIISCVTKQFFDLYFFPFQKSSKSYQTIWCPHGNSDKPKEKFNALEKEDTLIIYGKQMKELIPFSEKTFIQVGNFRYEYFLKHKKFYQTILAKNILSKLPPNLPIFLYAPTWEGEDLSSYPNAFYSLLDKLPDHFSLIVKLHPNIFRKEDIKRDIFIIKNEKRKNILFLENFPSIYPLLSICDGYIGDFSSIGYDFLIFDKPMFFLLKENENSFKRTPLSNCGIPILPKDINKIFSHRENSFQKFSKQKKFLYEYTFFTGKFWEKTGLF